MPRGKALSDLEQGLILGLISTEKTYASVARKVGRSPRVIENFAKRCKQEDGTFRIPEKIENRGRKKKTTDNEDRMIIREVTRNRFVSLRMVKQSVAFTNEVSLTTISRRIRQNGDFNSYWASNKPFISRSNQIKRVDWCNEHLNWTNEKWERVMWSDESPYVLRYNGKMRVWRHHNERHQTNCTRGTVKHDVKIMVWGAFSATGVGILHRIEGIMNKEIYNDLLANVMLPSADILFGRENWIFQQDNDPKHTAKINKDFLIENEVPTLPWPAQSPDLNPIENLWSILDQRLKNRQVNNAEELFQALRTEWNALPVDLLTDLVHSMQRRCQAVINSRGAPTKY